MPAPYPWWFANRVVFKYYWELKTAGTIARELMVDRKTVRSMVTRFESGLPAHKPKRGDTRYTSRKLRADELVVLKAIVDSNEELYLDEITERLSAVGGADVSVSTVLRALKNDLGYSRKMVCLAHIYPNGLHGYPRPRAYDI